MTRRAKWVKGAMKNWRTFKFKARPYARRVYPGDKTQFEFPDKGTLNFDFSFVIPGETWEKLKTKKTTFTIAGSALGSVGGGYVGAKVALNKRNKKRRKRK